MAVEVLQETHCLDTLIEIHQVDVAECVEHSAALLPERGFSEASRTLLTECPQMGNAQRRIPFGLTGSPRIGPDREQSYPREVKTTEGKKLVDDNRVTPEHLNWFEVLQVRKNEKKPDQELPPLPDRAIKGLKRPWVSPNGEPFHTVSLWEFENLYVLLGEKDWKSLSMFLKSMNLSVLSRQLKIGQKTLRCIRDNRNQSIVVPNLCKLCEEAELDLESVERMIRGVRFNKSGEIEKILFPFVMDIYAWRALCHIAGDGNIHKRKFPDLRWIQARENQVPMRDLLKRLSRPTGGESIYINYPKALSYAIMGTIPGMTLSDLRSPKFIQFVIDLPPTYRDWKIQFLAAFIIDDGCVSGDISFNQKDRTILEKVMSLCDQLGYDHSPYPPKRQQRDGMHDFQLRSKGYRNFYNDLNDLLSRYAKDSILSLWHKYPKLQNLVDRISDKRLEENQRSIVVYETILTILGDHQIRSSKQLREHPKLQPLVENYSSKIFRDRLRWLITHDLIQEVKKTNGGSYRPKRLIIPSSHDLETLIQEFHTLYGDRAHSQSYKRQFVTVEMANKAKARLISRGVKPNPTNTAREGGFSRKLFYERADLRALFEDDIEEFEE